jgi:epoxide hydrolase-like predicted phosphatase
VNPVVRCALFDFDGVFTDSAWFDLRLSDGLDQDEVQRGIEQLETGRISITEFFASMPPVRPAGRALTIRLRTEMVEYARLLRRSGIRTALITNTFRGFAAIRERAGVPDHIFDVVIESWRIGTRKPEAAIFEQTLAALQASPEQCVFIDDDSANIRAAARLGFTVILATTGHETLRRLTQIFGAMPVQCGG